MWAIDYYTREVGISKTGSNSVRYTKKWPGRNASTLSSLTGSVHVADILSLPPQYARNIFESFPQVSQTCSGAPMKRPLAGFSKVWCAGKDSNLRRPKPTGLQPVVIDHSTTDALHATIAITVVISKHAVCLTSLFVSKQRCSQNLRG